MGCALVLIGSATAGTPAVPAEADGAYAVRASPWASAAAEARVLADRILQRESDDLLLDGRRQRTLGHEIKQALSLIRRSYPAMASITARDAHGTATLLLGLEGALRDAVVGTWDGESTSAPPRTGHAAFDALNATLGLRAVQPPFPALDSVVLHLDERANIAAAIRAYRAIGGVAYAEPDAALGDGPDIEAAKVQGSLALRLSPGVGRLPLRLHRRGAFVLHRGGGRGRTDRARAGAQHGRLRGAPRPPTLALIGLEAGASAQAAGRSKL